MLHTANIRDAKALKDAAQVEHVLEEKKARAQEDAIRQVNQKMADKAMAVCYPIKCPSH